MYLYLRRECNGAAVSIRFGCTKFERESIVSVWLLYLEISLTARLSQSLHFIPDRFALSFYSRSDLIPIEGAALSDNTDVYLQRLEMSLCKA